MLVNYRVGGIIILAIGNTSKLAKLRTWEVALVAKGILASWQNYGLGKWHKWQFKRNPSKLAKLRAREVAQVAKGILASEH